MKVFLLLLWVSLSLQSQIKDIVKEYHRLNGENQEFQFIRKYENIETPSIIAYVVSLQMKRAEYTNYFWKKLSYFKQGKKRLQNLIKNNPNNIHLRYVRLVIQEKVLGLLGYKSNIEEDKRKLKHFLEFNGTNYLSAYIKLNTTL